MASVNMAQGSDGAGARLVPFLIHNPLSTVIVDTNMVVVRQPWGDDSLEFRFDVGDDEAYTVLNQLVLPPLFSAIWHRDTRDLEFIYSPIGVSETGRTFDFYFRGECIRCEFASPSPRLYKLASLVETIHAVGPTNHRNLGLFEFYAKNKETVGAHGRGEGASFWVRATGIDDDYVTDLARHLNFYMRYFDQRSAQVVIHERTKSELTSKLPQYPHGGFPAKISARNIDTFLLQLWANTIIGNPIHRFLYSYQIIEYVAFYNLHEGIRQAIMRVLSSPTTLDRPKEAARQILDAVVEDKMDDPAKIDKAIETFVNADEVCAAIRLDLPSFASEQEFDGGFRLPGLCGTDWKPRDQKEARDMTRKVATSLRKIRNAIVHSREARNVNSIAPTWRNQERVHPWLGPLSVITSQLLVYGDTD